MHGGYQPITPIQLGNLLQAYLDGDLTWQAVRVWFGCIEMKAIREAAGRSLPVWRRRKRRLPQFRKEELVKLTGLNRRAVGRGLGQLARTGLAQFSAHAIQFHLESKPETGGLIEDVSCRRSGRRLIPVPRTALRFLARQPSSTLGRVMLAYWVRGLALDRDTHAVRARGTVKATWIADVFGLSLRAVRYAQKQLREQGWISKDTGSKQWKLNRDGAYFQINLEWRSPREQPRRKCEDFARLTEPTCTPAAPPREDKFTPSESKDQCTQSSAAGVFQLRRSKSRQPSLGDIRREDLQDTARMRALFSQAVQRRWVRSCEADELKFFAAAVRSRETGGDAPRIFAGILRRGLWHHVTAREEDSARAWLTSPRPAPLPGQEPERAGLTLARLLPPQIQMRSTSSKMWP